MKPGLWILIAPLWCAGCGSASELAPEVDSSTNLALYNPQAQAASAAGAPAPACSDPDEDTLCDEEERLLGTDPLSPDTDGDALDDGLEVKSYTLNGRTLDLKALGANPRRKDIFLEVDYMPGWRPLQEAIDDVKRAFAVAPITNHDGSRGIELHIDVSNEVPLTPVLPALPHKEVGDIKGVHMLAERTIAYHYAIFAPRYGADYSSGVSLAYGPAAELLVTLSGHERNTKATTREKQAGTLMHELGHNLGLHHGGMDSNEQYSDMPYQPHYLSVMSYTYQFYGVHRNGVSVLDFARAPVRALNESSLDEVAAFSLDSSAPDPELLSLSYPMICRELSGSGGQAHCNRLEVIFGSPGKNLDLNRSGGTYQTSPVMADVDGDGKLTTIPGLVEEWTRLDYGGGGIIGRRSTTPRRDVVTEGVVQCATPAELDIAIADANPAPAEPQTPQLPDAPIPEQMPQLPNEPVPPPDEPEQPPVPPQDDPQWPEEPAPPPEEPVPPQDDPQWPEEPAPAPEDDPQWPEDPEDPQP